MKMILKPGGQADFRGGLEFLNPAEWSYDPQARELHLRFPQTSDERLQIFQLYVGQGVQRFDREQKEVVYHFDAQTDEVNVAGWNYLKPADVIQQAPLEPEPVLK